MAGMDQFSAVSETALITLRSRIIESEKTFPVIHDPVGAELLQRLKKQDLDESVNSLLYRKLPSSLTVPLALRARKYDSAVKEFLAVYPDGLIVSLGAGFDTRFWRLGIEKTNYIEVDLPEVIEAKKYILGDLVTYEMIGASVLEKEWIEEISLHQASRVLFLAEGLFMYLPGQEVIETISRMAGSFSDSRIVLEMVNKKYTEGFWKKIVESKMKRRAGTSAGSSYQYGVRDAKELEYYHEKIKIVEEWSFFEDEDIKPAFYKIFRNIRLMTRAQWTIIADLE